jgi:hypothetical protein
MCETPSRVGDAGFDAEGRSGGRGARWPLSWLAGGVAVLVGAPLGWVVSDRLEQRNDFCNACHLSSQVPLHQEVRRDFDALPAASLAGVHGAAHLPDAGGERDFRCIDCHGGTGLVGRARVKALAAKDALVYLTGHFDEPDGMRWPLWDEDCARCHERFDTSPYEEWESPRFHQLPVHNTQLGVACVECHEVHERGNPAEHHYLRAERVRTQCARCHAEFSELAQR